MKQTVVLEASTSSVDPADSASTTPLVLPEDARHELNRFYQKAGHKGRASAGERWLAIRQRPCATQAGAHTEPNPLIAALRLCPYPDYWLLRSLWVHPDWRKHGLGSRLLSALPAYLGNDRCITLPFRHLGGFYRAHGFRRLASRNAPPGLRDRYRRYLRRGQQLRLMQLWDDDTQNRSHHGNSAAFNSIRLPSGSRM